MTCAGNMTTEGTNMTDTNQTGSISQVTGGFEQETETEGPDITLNTDTEGGKQLGFGDNEQGNSNSDEEEEWKNKQRIAIPTEHSIWIPLFITMVQKIQ